MIVFGKYFCEEIKILYDYFPKDLSKIILEYSKKPECMDFKGNYEIFNSDKRYVLLYYERKEIIVFDYVNGVIFTKFMISNVTCGCFSDSYIILGLRSGEIIVKKLNKNNTEGNIISERGGKISVNSISEMNIKKKYKVIRNVYANNNCSKIICEYWNELYVTLWDLNNLKCKKIQKKIGLLWDEEKNIWSPDGKYFFILKDYTIKSLSIFNDNGEELFEFEVEYSIKAFDWSPDGKYLLLGTSNYCFFILNIQNRTSEYLKSSLDRTKQITWSPNGKYFALGFCNKFHIIDFISREIIDIKDLEVEDHFDRIIWNDDNFISTILNTNLSILRTKVEFPEESEQKLNNQKNLKNNFLNGMSKLINYFTSNS